MEEGAEGAIFVSCGNILSLVLSPSPQGEYKAQKEAVWAITNLTAGGSLEHVGSAV